jgi:AhpD family alkylhydroperoxidase
MSAVTEPTSTELTFTEYTIESAPAAARRAMTAVRDHLGYLPSAAARWAEYPALLENFTRLNGVFESSSLDPLARETVILTIAVRNGCDLCVSMHVARLRAAGASEACVKAVLSASPVPDERLEAARLFTIRLLDTTGRPGDDSLRAFLDAGYTRRNALEIVLGIGAYTLSTFANRLTDARNDFPG